MKTPMTQKMQFITGMDMTLMAIGCELVTLVLLPSINTCLFAFMLRFISCHGFYLPLKVELAHSGRSYSSSVDRYGSYGGSSSSRGLPRHSDYRGGCCLLYDFSYTRCLPCLDLI